MVPRLYELLSLFLQFFDATSGYDINMLYPQRPGLLDIEYGTPCKFKSSLFIKIYLKSVNLCNIKMVISE